MTGMRRGEALGLRWEDVDLENGRLCVRRALIPCAREVVVSEPKTARGRRVVALDAETVAVLKAEAARQLSDQHEEGDAWLDSGYVFTREDGHELDPEDVTRHFRQAVKKAMLPSIRLHDLRHTHATLALRAGVHPKVVSERLGHASVLITLDTYSHAIPAMQEEAARADRGAGVRGEVAILPATARARLRQPRARCPPPSTSTTVPVMKPLLASITIASATSWGRPTRAAGRLCRPAA